MNFRFNLEKAIQATGVLFRADHVNRMSYLRLLKLLYIADRECLAATNSPITGDNVVAMDNGPVLSQVYSLILGRHMGAPRWNRFFRKAHYLLEKSDRESGVGKLSKMEIAILQNVARRYEDCNEWNLVELTHEFEEWKKNRPEPKSVNPIPVEDILEGIGKKARLESIRQEQKDADCYDKIFGV